MKKVLAILTSLMISIAALAAVPGDTLIITANVPKVAPLLIMKGGFSNDSFTTTATQEGATLNYGGDVSESDLTVYIQLLQDNVSKYKNNFTATVTASNLVGENTSVPATAANSTNISGNHLNVTGSASGNTATFNLNYLTGRTVPANTLIGNASFTWATTAADMVAGNYTATITMTYTAP